MKDQTTMLIYELERMFSDVVYPGDQGLGDACPNEWESTLRRLRGKSWRQVTANDFDSQGGIIEGVQALSLKGFIYFLPGLVKIALTEEIDRYLVVSALLTMLTSSDDSKASTDSQRRIIGSLSAERRAFLIRFLEEMQHTEPTLCPVLIQSAASNLKNCTLLPYKQAELVKWAASSHLSPKNHHGR